MKLVIPVLSLMLIYVMGANLLKPVNAATSIITTAAGYTAPVVSLSVLLPLLFVVGLITGSLKGLDFAI